MGPGPGQGVIRGAYDGRARPTLAGSCRNHDSPTMKRCPLLPAAVLLSAVTASAHAQEAVGPTVEYIAHAAVIVESASGTRVLIDPYNGDMWMGYRFPEGLAVDAVLSTHPHYDHDASWYLDASTPVFQHPGSYRVGDIGLEGIEAEHAGAARFLAQGAEPYNTIWVLEVDGVRFAHLGDNRSPSAEDIRGIGGADVWFVTPFTPAAEVRAVARDAGVRIVVPVHYRLPELAAPNYRLATAEDWLADERDVVLEPGHRVSYAPSTLPSNVEFHVLRAHPGVRAWPPELLEAWALESRARERTQAADAEGAAALLRQAVELSPTVINFHLALAQSLVEANRSAEARDVLARGLAQAPRSDFERTLRTHGLLGRLLAEAGLDERAEVHYRFVVGHRRTYAADVLAEANAFLEGR